MSTTYVYDDLKRATIATRNNISLLSTYDANSRLTRTQRQGTNGTVITLSQTAYDFAGRIQYQTNALGGVTSYTYGTNVSGQLTNAVTFSDGGTRIEEYYADGRIAKITGSAVFPVRYDYGVESDGGVYRSYYKEIKLDASFNDTAEWTKTYSDLLGNNYKTVYAVMAGSPSSQSFFNSFGQLWKSVDPDSVTNLFAYNTKGEQEFRAIDLDGNGQINTNTIDRVTRTIADVTTNSTLGANVLRQRIYVWGTNNDSTATLLSTTETSVDGLKSWNTIWNNGVGITSKSETVYAGGGLRYSTNTAADGSYTMSTYVNGHLSSVTRMDSANTQISKTTFGFDEQGRQSSSTDARNGTTSFTFNNADSIVTTTTPAPGDGSAAQITTSYYDNLGRTTGQLLPDSTSVTNELNPNGSLRRTYGSRSYPVGYGYDAQGRMLTMTNWSGFPSTGARVTTWKYDGYRGFLTNKVYDGSVNGPAYAYTAAGRLLTRTWARGTNTTYSYTAAGDLNGADYSDSTADLAYAYDRRGRQTAITNGSAVCLLTYNDAGLLLVETNTGGTLNGLAVTNAYDNLLRRTALALRNQPSTLNQFSYDNASRLASVTNSLNVAAYTYVANSPLVSQIVFQTNGTTRMTTTKQYDLLNRLQSISSAPSASGVTPVSFSYAYNQANQRTRRIEADATYWVYQYDSLGQVTSGKKYWSDGTPVPGQQFEYAHDDIGNRTATKAGGDSTGSSASLRSATYGANTLNQYTNRTVPSAFDVLGASHATNSVTVNGSAADYRLGEYFQELLTVVNSSTSVWQSVTVTNSGGGSTTGNVFVPKTPELFYYDLDGNLTNDGRWIYMWDAENRLVNMTSASGAPTTASKLKLDFAYDWQGRRIQKMVSTNNGSIYVAQYTNRFVYDGWNVIALLKADLSLLTSFTWGIDLSGSMQGVGGVGGLLGLNDATTGIHFCAYDGNGNMAALVKASDGTLSASYEYGPFGEVIRVTGLEAKANPFRFSTKCQDDDADLLYYGYRYYNSSIGRWLSRDSIGEVGGANLYACANNDTANGIDVLGQWNSKVHYEKTIEWSVVAGFGATYAAIIGEEDIGTDEIARGRSWLPRPFGQQERHLNHPSFAGGDSRDYWYTTEFATAVQKLKAGDSEQNRVRCVEAAQHFGIGLHSRQDKSAHRNWPGGGDWSGWIAHPGWWDDWYDDEDSGPHVSDNFWRRYNRQPDYYVWIGSPGQQASQNAARQKVVGDSQQAITAFIREVRKTCYCRNEMLLNL